MVAPIAARECGLAGQRGERLWSWRCDAGVSGVMFNV
jgi:hypothetical protein